MRRLFDSSTLTQRRDSRLGKKRTSALTRRSKQVQVRYQLCGVKHILLSLRSLNRSGLPSTTYEMCAVAYEIGFEGFNVRTESIRTRMSC